MRYVVEYVCPGQDHHDQAFPLGIVAQDTDGVHVVIVRIDTVRAAAACDLPSSALTGWERDAAARINDPIFGPDGQPLDRADPLWLDRFAGGTLEGKFFFGPVRESSSSGPHALATVAEMVTSE